MAVLTRFSHYILGHAIIDREHREIYDALIALWRTTPPDLYPEQIQHALSVSSAHFEREDSLMIATDYPFVRSHLEVHFDFEQKILNVIKHPTKDNLEGIIAEFLHHIDFYDRPFVDYLIGIQYKFDNYNYSKYSNNEVSQSSYHIK